MTAVLDHAAPVELVRPSDQPTHRHVTVHVTAGLDGVLRVVSMLRGRTYRVTDLQVDVHEGALESRLNATVLLTADGVDLLVARLNRLPAVTSAVAR
ncbi:hypothetical protein GCM10009836_63290 [Pseudonocardia ailaonensis]|uniref:ACT domain-containing protein n=1 Tax=Pseudonocardia ailaonensis TaxID=367279 RepID=A0ABN2NNX8_9PSEU